MIQIYKTGFIPVEGDIERYVREDCVVVIFQVESRTGTVVTAFANV
jgi:hypothetical protein